MNKHWQADDDCPIHGEKLVSGDAAKEERDEA
jgi:hypothetical protein